MRRSRSLVLDSRGRVVDLHRREISLLPCLSGRSTKKRYQKGASLMLINRRPIQTDVDAFDKKRPLADVAGFVRLALEVLYP